MRLGADVLGDLPRKALCKVLFGIGFFGGHRMPPLAVAIESAAATIGDQVVGLEACRLVLEAACFQQGTATSLAVVENGPGFVCHDNQVILIVGLHS